MEKITLPENAVPVEQVHPWVKHLCRRLLKIVGWRADRWAVPPDVKKLVVIGEHHTSNMDSILMLLICGAMGRKLSWLVKAELDKPIIGAVIRATGGIFVDRHAKRGMVGQVVDKINALDEVFLVLAPSGTRQKTDRWRSGFYHIATRANVPLGLGYADYAEKTVGVGRLITLSGDMQTDEAVFREFYANIHARYPENASTVRLIPRQESPSQIKST